MEIDVEVLKLYNYFMEGHPDYKGSVEEFKNDYTNFCHDCLHWFFDDDLIYRIIKNESTYEKIPFCRNCNSYYEDEENEGNE